MDSFFETLFSLCGYTFPFWPVSLFALLLNQRIKIKSEVYVWGLWAIIRIILFFDPKPIPQFLIPEPWDTILFFVTGFVLIVIWVVTIVLRRNRLKNKAFRMTPEGLLELPPGEFEEMVAELYRAQGHQARRTGAIGDHGIDVMVKAKNGEKWVVQCKRWRTPVWEPILRDFYGMMQHEKAAQGAIIATKGFSQAAIRWARGKPIILYDGDDFIRFWKRVEKQKSRKAKEGLS